MEFTPQQLKVIPLLTLPEKVAAERLGKSQPTLKLHKREVIQKLGVKNTASAVAVLAQAGHSFDLFEAA